MRWAARGRSWQRWLARPAAAAPDRPGRRRQGRVRPGAKSIYRSPNGHAEVAALLQGHQPQCMLDVGAGPGCYSLALLAACPQLHAVALDLPGTLDVTRRLAAQHPARARLTLYPEDYQTAYFGRQEYDLILFSHVTHDESAATNRMLLRKAWAALRPGGRVAVHDFVLEADRTAPLFAALFAVHMLTYTRNGRTYTGAEYEDWLAEAGFTQIEAHPICPAAINESRLIVGIKA